MTLEEFKKLSDSILGKKLAKLAGFKLKNLRKPKYISPANGFSFWTFTLVDSLDRIAEVEKILIEKNLGGTYYEMLEVILFNSKIEVIQKYGVRRWDVITASARHRAEACYLCLLKGGSK